MKKYTYAIRWVGELVVILAVLAATPWVYEAFSTGGDNYYDPAPAIDCYRGTPYSAYAPRPIVQVGDQFYIAVFTTVYMPWYKGYNVGSLYFADKDTFWFYEAPSTIFDTVQHTVYAGGHQLYDWADDTTPFTQQILDTFSWSMIDDGGGSFDLHVRDTDHLGPPGTTDDPYDEVVSSYPVYWRKPNSETTVCIGCTSGKSQYEAYHLSRYSVTETRSDMSLSFAYLWMKESVEEISDTCNLQSYVVYAAAPRQLNRNSQFPYGDILAQRSDDPNRQAQANCQVVNH